VRKFTGAVLVAGLLVAGLVATAPTLQAADPTSVSSTMMALTTSPVFLLRLQYFLVQEGALVLAEPHATVCHAARFAYAQGVLGAPAQAAANAAALIVSTNVGGAVIVNTAVQWSTGSQYAGQWDTSAGDTALQTAVADQWNALARCDTGS